MSGPMSTSRTADVTGARLRLAELAPQGTALARKVGRARVPGVVPRILGLATHNPSSAQQPQECQRKPSPETARRVASGATAAARVVAQLRLRTFSTHRGANATSATLLSFPAPGPLALLACASAPGSPSLPHWRSRGPNRNDRTLLTAVCDPSHVAPAFTRPARPGCSPRLAESPDASFRDKAAI